MKMYLDGEWVDRDERIEVVNPFDGSVVDTVPKATEGDVERALAGAVRGAQVMRELRAYDRFQILRRTAALMMERAESLGRTISSEEGKLLKEGISEAERAAETIDLSAEEARRLCGEGLPLDAASNGGGKLGFTLKIPCGVVAAITPFNFPLNLVTHKVGPALAAGNAVILKPASDTPLSALRLVEILLEAGLPPEGIACITGGGSAVGNQLCSDERVRKISFTGSVEVGRHICSIAGLKKVTMELGSNSPLIVLPDADLGKVVEATVATGYSNAGQVCISTQRVIAVDKIHGELIDALADRVGSMRAGDQFSDASSLGPMVRERDAERVSDWIGEAVDQGARVVAGGTREGAVHQPTVLTNVTPDMKVSRQELFGPAVAVLEADSVQRAVELANDSEFGLGAGVFTQDVDAAMHFAQHVESGNIHINWGPGWRADLMPYGGLKNSGMGREGPKYAIEEMCESKTVVFHLRDFS